MELPRGILTLALLLCCYFYITLAYHDHGKGWDKHESHWKKGGHHHGEGEHGGKYKDDDWDKWNKHGEHENYDKGGKKHENYGKHHGGHDDYGKHVSGGEGHNAWGGHNEHGGKSRHHNMQDSGRKNKGFKNSYHKTENGDQTSYHDVSNQGNVQKDYREGEHWKKYGGEKFHKSNDGRAHFDEAERGDMHKQYGESGRDNHDGVVYKKGGDHHHTKWGHQDNGGKHYRGHEDVGGRGYSSGHGGYGGHEYGGHHH